MAENNFWYRPAAHADYDDVVAIGDNLYSGTDYIPALYHEYIEDPNRLCSVAFSGNKLVAFAMSYIVDGGETTIGQAARALPGYNVWKWFRGRPLRDHLKNDDKIRYVSMTTYAKSLHLDRIRQGKDKNKNFILRRNQITYFPTIEEEERVSSLSLISPLGQVKMIELPLLHRILCDKSNHWHLFPHGRIIISWEPFRLMESNYDLIVKAWSNLNAFATQSSSSDTLCESLSIGQVLGVALGDRYHVEYYGNDINDAIVHIQRHIAQMKSYREKSKNTRTIMLIFIPSTLDLEVMNNKLQHALDIQLKYQLNYHLNLFEKDLQAEVPMQSKL